MKKPWCYAILLLAGVGAWAQEPAAAPAADEALAKLMAGNQRYVRHEQQHPNQSSARRKELETGQHPIAVILACADSRVSPELLFDQGLGDLFVIRVAGNIVDDAVLGSIEYAVEQLRQAGHGVGPREVRRGFCRSRRRKRPGSYSGAGGKPFSPRTQPPARSSGTRFTTA